ncbi:hypothetical protein C8R47DRAFT_1083190 [Mycena vitilis]|nr:hypothetical protein C8R47DRAFT_1083190 [Mycena vitilis]
MQSAGTVAALPPGILSLPTEIICLIFSFTQAFSVTIAMTRKTRRPVLHTLVLICAQWCDIPWNLPGLWTFIPIADSMSATVELVDEFLLRSNDMPLRILLDIPRCVNRSRDGTAKFQDIFQKIMAASDRWQSLRIDTPTENVVAVAQNIECKAVSLSSHLMFISDMERNLFASQCCI